MAIVNTWNVVQMNEYPEFDGKQDVIFQVHWALTGTETVGETTYTGSVYGSVGVTLDPEAQFTSYADLTLEQVIGWVKDALGAEQVAAHEDNVKKQIADQQDHPTITLPLPWATLIEPLEAEA